MLTPFYLLEAEDTEVMETLKGRSEADELGVRGNSGAGPDAMTILPP